MAEPTYTLDEARTEIARQECRDSGHTFDAIAPTTMGEPDAAPIAVVCMTCRAHWDIAPDGTTPGELATPQRGQLWLYAYPGGGIDVVWIYEAASSTGDPQAIDGLGAYGPLETLTQGGRPVKKLADARDHPVNDIEGAVQ